MDEEYSTPPQFAYINDLIANLIQLNDGLANYRVSPKPSTRKWLLSCMAALYMKVRPKIQEQNKKTKQKKDTQKGPYEDLVLVMDRYLTEGIAPSQDKTLIKVALQLNEWVEGTGATNMKLDRPPLPQNQAVKERFRG